MSTKAMMPPGLALSFWPVVQLASLVARAGSALGNHLAFREARDQLMALDDRMLRDIGLDRSEIVSALLNDGGERRNGAKPPMTLRSLF